LIKPVMLAQSIVSSLAPRSFAAAAALAASLFLLAQPAQAAPDLPEAATGFQSKPGWALKKFGVAAANPLAAEAGYRMLKAGGNALDATIATQMVLALVEPQSSGIGGGAFLMLWDGKKLHAFDGRETAPSAATEGLFLRENGQPMSLWQAVVGGRSVATPGLLAMLEQAHHQHGKLPWAQLFEPAIQLASEGFEVSPRLHGLLAGDRALKLDPQARAYFYDAEGQAWPVGHRLKNPALAAVLRAVAERGSVAFYRGAVAEDMAQRVQTHAGNPGGLSTADLRAYRPLDREPICSVWRARWRICGFPPPSSGHLAVMQILQMLDDGTRLPVPLQGTPDAAWLHRYAEASRLAFADRAQYVADPAFVSAPGGDWRSLLAPDYLHERAALIGARAAEQVKAGQPGVQRVAYAPQPEQPEFGTSHISAVDASGQASAMTTSIEIGFGSHLMSDGGTGLAGGFLLNNHMTDFSLAPRDEQGLPVANRIEPGKRPRSSMSPTLVFDAKDGRFLMTLGSPGGPGIIHFNARTLLATLGWGMNAQQAIAAPNFGSFGASTVLEKGRFPSATVEALRALGHQVSEAELTSGLQAIERTPSGWFGAADPRREGMVRGE
jgi:gamma-glutamyltranspeptidase/glutathione hydrolase